VRRGDVLATGEVAKLLHVTPHTVNRWVREGRLVPSFRTPGGHYRFTRAYIMSLMVQGMTRGAPLDDIV
jgi:excisionase family DNA binding protein